uniref:Divergent polysaccharide deacetylase n=1 Tax=Candidatus Kentrum sp. FW TaxID=2126338 RepID=A0A450STK3_9GAMM|nr:MAG: hypothetical protein BECKFW1821B_GA0114236_103219 [Candidatus Kentron sp. FW]VFJ61663.1 MAG: hypothetical protein BECKFW1821A_GA0114235_11163 [Candidatus Kentron sp. FW]
MPRNHRHRVGLFPWIILLWLLGFGAKGVGIGEADTEENIPPAPSSPPPEPTPAPTPLISIIIDDLGYRLAEGMRSIELPGPVTFSIIPHSPHAKRLSTLAHGRGKEIMVHIPMESQGDHYLEPRGLTTRMTRAELFENVHAGLASLPHARGLNNHMGSLLTRRLEPMRWLMEAILEYDDGLYFVDSRTTARTVAMKTARQYEIPSLERDVFLDHVPKADAILTQFLRMIGKARSQGTALGIGHPYPETLDLLHDVLPRLQEWGVTLVPVSVLLAEQAHLRQQLAGGEKEAGK